MCSCVLCRRLSNQARSRARNGRPARHDGRFPVRTSWDFGRFGSWNRFNHSGSAARTCRISRCTGLVASDRLRPSRFAGRRSLSAIGQASADRREATRIAV